jgi:hypothetical protein
VTVTAQESSWPLLLVIIALLVAALVAAVVAWRRAARLGRRLDALTRGRDGDSLEDVLGASIGQVVQLSSEVAELSVRTGALETRGRKALQRIGLVRYNPFEDTGGNQSFALALLDAEVDRLTGRTAALERDGRKAFQRIGLVRFNPFEDTGGNQSFALALLDADDDGIVLSSLHARGGTRIYAKTITGGCPEATLSEEESDALALARGASAGRVALAERTGPGPVPR